MKYLVLSDSHGHVDNIVRAVEREKPDGIIHLGDCWRDAEELHELFPRLPLEQVPGNCDFGRFEALERVLILDDHRVLIAHGHTMGVKTGCCARSTARWSKTPTFCSSAIRMCRS